MTDFWAKPKSAVAATITVLEAAFPGVTVRSEKPKTRPSQFIVVSLLSSSYPTPAFTVSRPLVECWAETSATAEDMCNTGIQALRNARAQVFATATVTAFDNIYGPTELNDPDIQDRRRWQFHGDLYLSTR